MAVEPDCSVAMLHCTGRPLPVGWLQMPEDTAAEVKATGRPAKLSVNVMPVARSGPLFVIVYLKVAGLPALTNCCPDPSTSVPVTDRTAAVPNFATKASGGLLSVPCTGTARGKLVEEVVSPAMYALRPRSRAIDVPSSVA